MLQYLYRAFFRVAAVVTRLASGVTAAATFEQKPAGHCGYE